MGRKIPGKRHRGVKDPEKQRENREKELKTKVRYDLKFKSNLNLKLSLYRFSDQLCAEGH